MVTLGFVGLGQMGGPMATQLIRADHDVIVFDRDSDALTAAVETGARAAESAAEIGERSDVVFLSLPDPETVETVVSELETTLESGSVIVDLTTSMPETTSSLADWLSNVNVTILGAPVSGGTAGAQNGTLTVMVGGDAAAFESCKDYLKAFASNVFHVGTDPGHGHAIKLLNNYLSDAAMVATAEAVILGQQVGLDIATMCEVFNVSTGRNSATEDKFPEYIANGREVGFALELMEKDLDLLCTFAEDNRAPLLLGNVVRSQVGYTRTRYGDDGDMTDVYGYLHERMTGSERDSGREETS